MFKVYARMLFCPVNLVVSGKYDLPSRADTYSRSSIITQSVHEL